MTISPMPTSSRPGPISQRAGTRSLSRPASVAVTAAQTAIRVHHFLSTAARSRLGTFLFILPATTRPIQ
jgi:hypothetical protein